MVLTQLYMVYMVCCIKTSFYLSFALGPISKPCTTLCVDKTKTEPCTEYAELARVFAILQIKHYFNVATFNF